MTGSHKKGGNKPRSIREGTAPPLPSKAEILEFIQENPDRASKRDIARAFGIKGADRIPLKRILHELAHEGHIEKRAKRTFIGSGELPPVTVIEITNVDSDGEMAAKPANWTSDTAPPTILLAPGAGMGRDRAGSALGISDRVLAKLTKIEHGAYEARIMRRIEHKADRILGVYQKVGRDGRIMPIERGSRTEYSVRQEDDGGASNGELVFAEPMSRHGSGPQRARITEHLGSLENPRTISLIAIHNHDIPFEFPTGVEESPEKATAPTLKGRTDLRHIPFITIDPADARDHDDAVWAEPDDSPNNVDGHIVWVAIADVAHFVATGSAMDKEALRRGNSCYFPDRVVPMLPDRLSGGLCSLHEDEDRACLAVRMVLDKHGVKQSHEFVRGMMRSRGSLTYTQVQTAIDGTPDERTSAHMEGTIMPLWRAYKAMEKARNERQPLQLEVPEHKIELGPDGRIAKVSLRKSLPVHRLIEDFMVLANVCAAETLEKHHTPLIYRVHEPPGQEKVTSLEEFLASIEIKLAKGQALRTQHFNRILERVKDTEFERMTNEVILRSQSQACYSPDNLGHFGLNLARYAHFTSPIRRYADLIVHRALIRACKLGDDGLADSQIEQLTEIAEQISNHERRAMAAERESNDRYVAAFLEEHIGAEFDGRIAGVTHFGLFVKLDETGADGLVPIRRVGGYERYNHDERRHALVGEVSGGEYKLGDVVRVRLEEATPLTGGLILDLLTEPTPGKPGKDGKKQQPHKPLGKRGNAHFRRKRGNRGGPNAPKR